MKNNNAQRISGVPVALGIAILLGACANLPDIEEAEAVQLSTSFQAPWAPEVDVDGNPNLRPGAMAMDGLEASAMCDYLFVVCAVVFVPISAATGADAAVQFTVTEFWWEVSIGNQVSLHLTVEAHGTHRSEFGRRRFAHT